MYMEKYILGEIFSPGGATLYKNPSDQTVIESFLLILEYQGHDQDQHQNSGHLLKSLQ